jgi:hypothetical protein
MKIHSFFILLPLMFSISAFDLHAQGTLGIYQVLDERNNLDYSQLFLNYFEEKPLSRDGESIETKLINYPVQAGMAIKLRITDKVEGCQELEGCQKINLSLYKEGKRFYQSEIESDCITKSNIIVMPNFEIEYEQIETGINKIISVPPDSKEAEAGIKKNDYIGIVSLKNGKVIVPVKRDITEKKWNQIKLDMPYETEYHYVDLMTISDLDCLFRKICEEVANQFGLNINGKLNKELGFTKEVINLSNYYGGNYPCEYLPGNFENIVTLAKETDLFRNLNEQEKFKIEDSKKINQILDKSVGNSSILNHFFYNQNKLSHKFEKQKEVDDKLNDMIDFYITPFHDKPGVVANYINSGDEYMAEQQYESALNQYSAGIRKLTSMHASLLIKTEVHTHILQKISQASDELKMTKYSDLMDLSTKLYKLQLDDWNEKGQYYIDADNLAKVCGIIEEQVRTKKKKKLWGVIKGVASAGAGVAMADAVNYSEYGLEMASDLLQSGAQVMADNFTVAEEISNSINLTTSSLDVDSESLENSSEGLQIQNYFLRSLIENLDQINNIEAIFVAIEEEFGNKSEILSLIKSLDLTKPLSSEKNHEILSEIGRIEKDIYNYEVRSIEVPEHIRL